MYMSQAVFKYTSLTLRHIDMVSRSGICNTCSAHGGLAFNVVGYELASGL